MKTDNIDWLYNPLYYQWITFERFIDPEAYAKAEIERAVQLGAGTYLYYVQAGGRTIYDSRLAERAEELQGDLMKAFVDEAHRRDIRFVAAWLATIPSCSVEVREHPDWIRVKLDGSRNDVTLCYNTPYRDFLFNQVEEVLSGYEVDGIYFDQVPVGCFCHYCRTNYESRYVEPFPTLPEGAEYRSGPAVYIRPGEAREYGIPRTTARKLNDFVVAMRGSWVKRIRHVIDTTRPDCKFIANRIEIVDAADFADDIDAFLPESGLAFSYRPLTPFRISVERQLSGVYAKRPVWEVVKYDKMGVRSGSLDRFNVLLAEAVSHGHVPVMRDQDTLALRTDRYREKAFAIARTMNAAGAALRSIPDMAYAAVLHSRSTFDFSMQSGNESFYGIIEFLKERALPYRIVSEADVQADEIRAGLLILADCCCLEDDTVTAVERFAEHGGSVLATGRAGELRPDGSRRKPDRLAALCGVERVTWIENIKPYPVPMLEEIPIPALHNSNYAFVRIAEDAHPVTAGLEGGLTDFNRGYVECAAGDARVIAWICDFDQRHINSKHFNRRIPFPGKPRTPFLTVKEGATTPGPEAAESAAAGGAGRIAYVAAPVCKRAVREGAEELQELLYAVVRWCGGPFVVESLDLPPSVKLTARGTLGRQDAGNAETGGESLAVMLHTNELVDIRRVGYRNARIAVKTDGRRPSSCTVLVGSEPSYELDGERLIVTVPEIEPVAAFVLSF